MAGVMVSAATGVMNSVVDKLTTLLGEEYKLAGDVRHGIRFMKDELSSMNAALQRLADMDDDQIDVQTKEWRSKVRELSYDTEDCIDRFMLLHSSRKAKLNSVRSIVQKIKMLWEDRKIAKEIAQLKALVVEEKERRDRYNIDQYLTMTQPILLDPRAPTLYEDARDLVGIDGPREQIIGWLKGDESQLKVVSIFGIGGQGKTTLATEVYRRIEEPFDCRALVSVSRTPDIKKLLRGIFFQIDVSLFIRSEGWEMEQLIPTMREYLMNKRYLIVVDDIWSTLAWEHVKSALPNNNNRSRIITSTRNKDVARSCCSSIYGLLYEAKPLSQDDSRRLFSRRIFCSTEDCPQELREVANDILRKCGGLPLAIISIAGLLASRSQTMEAWINVRNSISSTIEKDSPTDKMRRILSLSYFDLPHHLKTCLLYLSVFPEDYSIDTRHLIWRWVAEGFVAGENRESMDHLGECYLHELINRSMIQPTEIGVDGRKVKFCRVHDIILDFIVSQAMEVKFVNIFNSTVVPGNSSTTIRRLSLQPNCIEAVEIINSMRNVSHLRSINMFGSDLPELGKEVPLLLNCQALRVLNIEGAKTIQDYHVEHIGNFMQLKYLRITDTGISKLPEQMGNLQHLQILDLTGNDRLKKLPSTIVQLKKLVRLFLPWTMQLPDGIQNLQALEVLSGINLETSIQHSDGLRQLTKLRELKAYWVDHGLNYESAVLAILELIGCSLQSLRIVGRGNIDDFTMLFFCPTTPHLQRLVLFDVYWTSIPSQIGSLLNLTRLRITVSELNREGLYYIASLPRLLSLTIMLDCNVNFIDPPPMHVISSQGFQQLVKFNFSCDQEAALKFVAESMPRLQRLKLELMARGQFKYGQDGLVVGLHHLLGLKHLTVYISCQDAVAQEVNFLENDIRGAVSAHPNRPILVVHRNNNI